VAGVIEVVVDEDVIDLTGRRRSRIVARRDLARHLVRLRGAAGLSQPRAARGLRGVSRSKLQYLESGERSVSDTDLEAMLDLYEADADDRQRADDLSRAAAQPGWWDEFPDADLSPVAKHYVGLEWGTRLLRVWSGSLVAPLLQTAAYTEAVLAASEDRRSPEQITALLESRRRRQAVLEDPDPLEHRVVMDEAALLRPAGPPPIMADQIDHIIEVMQTHPRVDVRIVPFSAGIYPGTVPRFTVMTLEGNERLVLLEPGLAAATYLDDRYDLDMYSRVFERLFALATEGSDTLEMLHTVGTKHRAKEGPQ
jgi:transcriptional regulator with XRE-family HTH domain